jgi:spermidine/putrescine transport system permease protein
MNSRARPADRLGQAVAALYLAACYVFIFLPVATLVLFSFHEGSVPVPPFEGPTLRWYERVLTDGRLMEALRYSLGVAIVSALISTALGFLAAYGLGRHRVPGTPAIRWLLIAPLTVSYLIVGMGLLITFNSLGLGRSLWHVVIGHVVINLPLAFAIVTSQLGDHQARLERAARDLGAGEFRVVTLVTIPLIWPALFAAMALCFTLSWDEFIIAYLLTRFDVTLPVVIWNMLRSGLDPQTNAAGTLVFFVSIALVLCFIIAALGRRRRGRTAATTED